MAEPAPKSGEFHDGKMWFTRKGNLVTLGLTSLAIEELGDVEKVELPNENADFEKGEALGMIAGTQGSVELLTPATGMIQELNKSAAEDPTIVTEDPEEEGWLVRLEIEDPTDLKEFASDH